MLHWLVRCAGQLAPSISYALRYSLRPGVHFNPFAMSVYFNIHLQYDGFGVLQQLLKVFLIESVEFDIVQSHHSETTIYTSLTSSLLVTRVQFNPFANWQCQWFKEFSNTGYCWLSWQCQKHQEKTGIYILYAPDSRVVHLPRSSGLLFSANLLHVQSLLYFLKLEVIG